MNYIFIFNGLPSRKWVVDEVESQIRDLGLECTKYVTLAPGDATRFVNLHCDLNPRDEDCFIACGGSGTTNEVMSAIVGRENKYMGILAFGGTNDFVKMYPGYDFTNVSKLFGGTPVKVDAIRVNDNYAINVVNAGLDAYVTLLSRDYLSRQLENPYVKALKRAVLRHRFHRMTVYADGVRLNRTWITNAQFANGRYYGGEFLCAPNAAVDDGLMEVGLFKPMGLLAMAYVLPRFRKGEHMNDPFCRLFFTYVRAKHVELRSKDILMLTVDGENIAAESADIDIVPESVKFILPRQ